MWVGWKDQMHTQTKLSTLIQRHTMTRRWQPCDGNSDWLVSREVVNTNVTFREYLCCQLNHSCSTFGKPKLTPNHSSVTDEHRGCLVVGSWKLTLQKRLAYKENKNMKRKVRGDYSKYLMTNIKNIGVVWKKNIGFRVGVWVASFYEGIGSSQIRWRVGSSKKNLWDVQQ